MTNERKPQPRDDRYGTPFCHEGCQCYDDRREPECDILGRPLNCSDRFCEPAVREMAAELERLYSGLAKLYQAIGQASVDSGDEQAVIVAMDGCYGLIPEKWEGEKGGE